jgi:hypothetical protein
MQCNARTSTRNLKTFIGNIKFCPPSDILQASRGNRVRPALPFVFGGTEHSPPSLPVPTMLPSSIYRPSAPPRPPPPRIGAMESSDLLSAAVQLLSPTAAAPLAPSVHACSPAAAHAAIKKRKCAATATSPASPAVASPTVASQATARAVITPAVARRKKVAGRGPKKVTQGGGKKQVVNPRAATPQASPPVAEFTAPQRSDAGAGNMFDEMPSRYDVSRFSCMVVAPRRLSRPPKSRFP